MKIVSAEYIKSSANHAQCPAADKAEFAFIGRSNVGKSSLINMLCDKKGLAKISGTPGKTQLINHFNIVSSKKESREKIGWYLVDLPGYGYAKVSQKQRKTWSAMIEKYILHRENLANLFVLIDSRHDPQKIDIDFINQLGKWNIPFTIIFTKEDKNKPGATLRNVTVFMNQLKESWEILPHHIITSAITGAGKNELLENIAKILKNS
jgi:GTP-binding protein